MGNPSARDVRGTLRHGLMAATFGFELVPGNIQELPRNGGSEDVMMTHDLSYARNRTPCGLLEPSGPILDHCWVENGVGCRG